MARTIRAIPGVSGGNRHGYRWHDKPFSLTGRKRYMGSRVCKLPFRGCAILRNEHVAGVILQLGGNCKPGAGSKLGAARSSPSILKETFGINRPYRRCWRKSALVDPAPYNRAER